MTHQSKDNIKRISAHLTHCVNSKFQVSTMPPPLTFLYRHSWFPFMPWQSYRVTGLLCETASKQTFLVCTGSPTRISSLQPNVNTCREHIETVTHIILVSSFTAALLLLTLSQVSIIKFQVSYIVEVLKPTGSNSFAKGQTFSKTILAWLNQVVIIIVHHCI